MSKYRHKTLMYFYDIDETGTAQIGERKRKRIQAEVRERFAGQRVQVTFKPAGKEKTLKQLGYFYGVILPYVCYGLIQAGNDIDIENSDHTAQVEKFLKNKFLNNGIELHDGDGTIVMKGDSSLAEASKQQTMDFIDDVINFAQEDLKTEIPPPEEGDDKMTVREYLKKKLELNV